MFRNLFKPDSGLMITMTQITDCIFLSLFCFLCSVPVVTLGASIAAMYDAVYYGFRKEDKHSWQRFFSSFRSNLKAGILPTLVFLAVFLPLVWVLIQFWNGAVAETISWTVFAGIMVLGALVLGILSVLFPMLSRFENPLPVLLKNTVLLALANMPRTLALGILNSLTIFLCMVYVIPVFFLPALAALIGTLFIEPMFKPYL